MKYRHLEFQKNEAGRIMNVCPFGKKHKNGALVFMGGLSCVQCKFNHGLDDDGNLVCGFGVDNLTPKNKKE